MDFLSIRVITADPARLVAFYERATGVKAAWATEDFAELRTARATLAIAAERTVNHLAPGAVRPAENRSVIIEFLVEDVDRLYRGLTGLEDLDDLGAELVGEPATMPWGNRSLLLRDPDGNLVNFFTPATPAAVERFAR
jgi:catechol 2,3-dioxygenase-like lactoylglutathione lyase family enzyme